MGLNDSYSFVGVNEFGVVVWSEGYFLIPTTKILHYGLYAISRVYIDMTGFSMPKCKLLMAILRQAWEDAEEHVFTLLDADYLDPDYLVESERKLLLKKNIIFWRK